MKMLVVAAALTAVALLLVAIGPNADATTIYVWYPANQELPIVPYGQIELTDAAQLAGSLNYSFYGGGQGNLMPGDPESPILEILFAQGLMPRYPSDYPWYIDAKLKFGEYLTGNLSVNGLESTYNMSTSGKGQLWTITSFSSDDPYYGDGYGACHDVPCSGATGYWILEQGPVPVPEPDMFAAFGILAFALLVIDTARRWRRDHHRPPVAYV